MAVRPSNRCRNLFVRHPPSTHSLPRSYAFAQFFLLLAIVICLCIQPSDALHNVTVDDKDPRIAYRGTWERTPNFEEYSAGGGHMMTFKDPGASASFTFKGTAVYLSYPLWPYNVSSGWISLDGKPPVRLSLLDPNHSESDGGRATTPSSVQMFIDNLDPEVEHSIVVSATDTDTFVVFDSITYTELEPGDEPIQRNVSSSSATVSTSIISPTSTSSSSSSKEDTTRVVIIAVCVVAALLVLLSIPLTLFLCKRRREKKEREQWRQESLQEWNVAYGNSEPKPLDPPVYTPRPTFPRSPNSFASSGSTGTIGYAPSPPPAATYNLVPQDERYFEQMRAAHSHMMPAKSSLGPLVAPVTPPAVAVAVPGREVQRSQSRGLESEVVPTQARQYRSLRTKRHYSNDSITGPTLSYASDHTFVAVPQPSQATDAPAYLQTSEAADTTANDVMLENERRENEHYRLRLRNARQTMMTVNTISAPPAYEDSAYPPPPPPIPEKSELRRLDPPSSFTLAGDSRLTSGVPSGSGQYRLQRMTQVSALQNPWDQVGGEGLEDDFGGKTLVETSPIRGGFGSARQSSYTKAPVFTLASSS